MKFEDLNKQLCSNNLFTKIDSSIPATEIDNHTDKQIKSEATVKFEPENYKYAHFDLGPNSENFMSECMKIINKKDQINKKVKPINSIYIKQVDKFNM